MTFEELIYSLMNFRAALDGFLNHNLFWFEFFGAVLSLLLFWGIVYVVLRLNLIAVKVEKFIDVLGASDISKRRAVKSWVQVKERLRRGDEANLKLALIEADKILDELVKLSGYRGETMSDRLKQVTPAALPNIEAVWAVHKTRNRLVHEPDHRLSRADAEAAVAVYEKAFRDMGLIE